uniref:TPR_REGION domain-containing protein n=1 Tax=Echinostoma caproni TaxID=27848 RepID=A0A183AIJ3_9TREM
LLARIGLLHLKKGEEAQAFEQIGTALSYKPNHFQATLAATSVMIAHGDYDVALSKYRNALRNAPEDAVLWNNIGVAYFGKKKLLSSLVCLRRAAYLDPLNWIIAANRGIVALHTGQYACAAQMLYTSIHLKRNCDKTNTDRDPSKRPKSGVTEGTGYSEGMLHGLLALAYIGLEDLDAARQNNLSACKLDS